MSASAPDGRANKNIGRLAATCTKETSRGSAESEVINQPDAELYIHVPMFATSVAVQITA
jgi:hypothetical protein